MDEYELKQFADKLRYEAIRMVYEGGDGHPGPAFSIADIIAVLYGNVMRIDPQNPQWPDRDRLILSKGHACPIWYAALSEKGYFGKPIEHFHLRELGSKFQGHPVMNKTEGVDMTSGSLGNGIPIGAGMAMAAKQQGRDFRVYVVTGDGELNEGVAWEGAMIAAHHKLGNLTVFVDNNGWQSGGSVEDVSGNTEIGGKFASFGWNVCKANGHDYAALQAAIQQAKDVADRPTAIICDCVKGKGLPYMENNNDWHKKVPTDEQFALATKLLVGGDAE